VRAGIAALIVTVAVGVMGMKAINPGTVITTRVSNPVASPSPPATITPSPTGGAAPLAAAPPYPVEQDVVGLVDPSRDTPARGVIPAQGGRQLITVIRRPTGPPGPRPLVVFAHGWNVNPTSYEPLLDAWASAGYLVAAPTFPDSANTLPGSPVSNYPEQARDISFVITALLGGRAGPVEPSRIAVAGHSDGGTDVALLALNPAYADPRVRAYLSLSGEVPSGVPGPWGTPTSAALLVAVGTRDKYGLFPRSRQVFEAAAAPKVLLTVAGGDHMGIYTGASPQAVAVRHETVRFLDVALRAKTTTSADLTSALEPAGDPSILVSGGPSG
jgi:fermentation-respiration switch protein FrsA (DUF1100 family)